ncbi:MAG: transposase [Syntrophomonas sp.]|nr:transposase [Syntrophomonas sp.]
MRSSLIRYNVEKAKGCDDMPRKPREKSETGIYHIIVRGINQQDIFHEEDDFDKYLEAIRKIGLESGITVLGYCLMSNHVHLLVKESDTDISVFMKRHGVSYAYWYNCKYERHGHVFQDRFKSECVEDDAYLLTVIRYIHNNPVKAKIVNNPEQYQWSSCAIYYEAARKVNSVDTRLILGIFSVNEKLAIERFRNFMQEGNEDQCLGHDKNQQLGEREAYRLTVELLKGKPVSALQTMEPEIRNQIMSQLRYEYGLGLRQLSRITGLPLHIVRKI